MPLMRKMNLINVHCFQVTVSMSGLMKDFCACPGLIRCGQTEGKK